MLLLLFLPTPFSLNAATPLSAPNDDPLPRFPLDKGPLVWQSIPQSGDYIEALGEQASLWGTVGGPLEAWAWPFKLVYDLQLEFSPDGGQTFLPASQLIHRQIAAPHLAQLQLKHPQFSATQTLFVPRQLPAAAILLDINTKTDLQIALHFRVSLAPMLMSAASPPQISWNSPRRQLTAFEGERKIKLLLVAPHALSHQTLPDGAEKIILKVSPPQAKTGFVPIFLAASWPDSPPADITLKTLSTLLSTLFRKALDHYQNILKRAPLVESPDPLVNEALAWSVISLHQLRIRNPFLGHGLVSGYAPAGPGNRPGFAWFFDEPTLTSWAYLRAGLAGHITEAFRFLLRYQRPDGKMVHEITQSLPYYPDYFDKYKYAYIHASSGTYFLAACGHYFRSTGDWAFIRQIWPQLKKMLDWCGRAVDPDDGLMQIAPREWGSSESSFEVGKDTQMVGMWLCALREMTYLADAMNEQQLAGRCQKMADRAADSLEEKFWDRETSTYYWGLDRAGRPLRSLVPHHSVSLWMKTLRPDRVPAVLERMTWPDVRTDWGARSLAASDPRYQPDGYQTGVVWPVWNTGLIIGEFRHHRPIQAFRHWLAMIHLRRLSALGPMPETINGHFYRRFKHGVPHQMFSETAIQNGFYEGLLGLDLDVPARRLTLAPRLPVSWDRLTVKRIPLGPDSLDLILRKNQSQYTLSLDLHSKNNWRIDLQPLLPGGAQIQSITLDNRPLSASPVQTPSGVSLTTSLANTRGKHALQIQHTNGKDLMVEDTPLKIGSKSQNLRLIRADFKDHAWHLLVAGLPDTLYPLKVYTDQPPRRLVAAQILSRDKNTLRIGLQAPPDAPQSSDRYVRWNALISWK